MSALDLTAITPMMTVKGGFLLGCMLMAIALILTQCLVSFAEARKAQAAATGAATEKVQEAAKMVQGAAETVTRAAEKNKQAATANMEAATASGASSTAGVEALRMIRNNNDVLELVHSQVPRAGAFLTEASLNRLDAEKKAGEADEATGEATEQAEGATAKAEEAVEAAKATADASFFGTLQGISLKLPLVGGALLFTLVGGLGAGLIKFSIG